MKVLAKGRLQQGWSIETNCTGYGNQGGGCGAMLLVEQPDLFQTGKHSYDGSSDYFITFKCVECGVWTDLEDHVVPQYARPTYRGNGGRQELPQHPSLGRARDNSEK